MEGMSATKFELVHFNSVANDLKFYNIGQQETDIEIARLGLYMQMLTCKQLQGPASGYFHPVRSYYAEENVPIDSIYDHLLKD